MSAIVVGYDGTDCAKAALDAACALAVKTGHKVVLGFGYEPYHGAGEVAPLRNAVKELGENVTAEGLARAQKAGADAEVKLVSERPAPALVALAEEVGADFIVVGSYGEKPLRGAILGTTPHKLLGLSPVPVIVVPARD